MKQFLFWTPRLLCIAFAAFLAIFALDVFNLPLGPADKAFALMMHLIPSAIVLFALAIVWRWEWVGVFIFPGLAMFHLVSKWGQLDWSGYALVEAPLLLLGILFLGSWRNRRVLTPRTS